MVAAPYNPPKFYIHLDSSKKKIPNIYYYSSNKLLEQPVSNSLEYNQILHSQVNFDDNLASKFLSLSNRNWIKELVEIYEVNDNYRVFIINY